MNTKQTGTLEDYISTFGSKVAQLPDFSGTQYLGFFLRRIEEVIECPDSSDDQ